MNYVNRKYKDTLFRALFSERKHLLSLYNAVNGTDYTNEDDLEVNTLDNVIYMKMKNDISFLFGFSLNLYEHQSSVNPNMPLRDLFYVADLLQKIVKDKNLYSSCLVGIPTPKFVMFYNGTDVRGPDGDCGSGQPGGGRVYRGGRSWGLSVGAQSGGGCDEYL